ncbi:MAG: NADPH2:quinone reductase [Bradymonadia bacterium]
MKIAHIVCLDGPDAIEIKELPDPTPGAGEVLIEVHSAGVNFPDILMSRGLYQMRPPMPFAPGGEIAGIVTAVGEGASFSVGDRVMSLTGFGGFSTHIVVQANRCVRVPESMSLELAGAFAFTYGTSYHALVDRAGLAIGETLLVLGAAGGVGSAAVEIGAALGATIIAAASTAEKLSFATSLGATKTINYATEDLKKQAKALSGGGVDVTYDPVGGELSPLAFRAMAPGGRHLVIGFAAGAIPAVPWNLALLKQCAIVGVAWGMWTMQNPAKHTANIEALAALHVAGKLNPRVTRTYALTEVAEALHDMEGRRVIGKIAIDPRR